MRGKRGATITVRACLDVAVHRLFNRGQISEQPIFELGRGSRGLDLHRGHLGLSGLEAIGQRRARPGRAPFIALGDDTVIREGMTFSVEPGLYDAQRGIGINPSDRLLVTKDRGVLMSSIPFTKEWSFLTL